MTPPGNRLRACLVLAAGLAQCLGLGLGQSSEASRRVVAYGQAHARGDAQGFLVWLYDNPFQTGAPKTLLRPAPRLHQARTPEPQRPYPFSWRWLTLLEAHQDGAYLLGVYSNLAVRLRLDGRSLVESWVADPNRQEEALVELAAGPHLLDLTDLQANDSLDLVLYWIPPDSDRPQVIPSPAPHPLDQQTSAAQLWGLYFSLQRWQALTWLLPLAWLGLWWLLPRDWRRGLALIREHWILLLVLALAAVLRRAWARGPRWTPPRWRPLVWAGLAAYGGLCLASLGVNYFYSHLQSGGRPLVWNDPLFDHVSDAWMNHRPLVEELARRGYPVVATGDYWHHTLHLALNLYQAKPPAFWAVAQRPFWGPALVGPVST